MKISLNKTFSSREELDNFVRGTFGEDAEKNRTITIEGDDAMLKKLNLSESSQIFGVKIAKIEASAVVDDTNVDPAEKIK